MERIDLFHFCMMFYGEKEIRLHLWSHDEDENEICSLIVVNSKFPDTLYKYRDFEVIQFKSVERGVIDVTASNF